MTARRSFLESGCLAANYSHDNKTEVIGFLATDSIGQKQYFNPAASAKMGIYQEEPKVNLRKAAILANVKYLLVILVSKQNNLFYLLIWK